MQSVPIITFTKVVRTTPAHGEMYSIQHYVIKFVISAIAKTETLSNVLNTAPIIVNSQTSRVYLIW